MSHLKKSASLSPREDYAEEDFGCRYSSAKQKQEWPAGVVKDQEWMDGDFNDWRYPQSGHPQYHREENPDETGIATVRRHEGQVTVQDNGRRNGKQYEVLKRHDIFLITCGGAFWLE